MGQIDDEGFRIEPVATTDDDVARRHDANRAAWNEGAIAYHAELDAAREFIAAGRSNLHPIERRNLERYGPLAAWCRRAIHLQCAGGRDTLSLRTEGALEVIGVDISDRMIAAARELSRLTGVDASWYCCDVLDTPVELDASADLVYTGRGALCWIQDISGWARVIARLLKPGGVASVYDGHPLQWLVRDDSPTLEFAAGTTYFSYAISDKGWPEEYIGRIDGIDPADESRKYERNWTVAEVVQAIIDSGLVVEVLGEHPEDFWDALPHLSPAERERIPNTFSVCARKPLR